MDRESQNSGSGIIEFLWLLKNRKLLFFVSFLFFGLIGGGIIFLLPAKYSTKISILPTDTTNTRSSLSVLAAQFGALPSLVADSKGFNSIMAVIESRRIARAVMRRNNHYLTYLDELSKQRYYKLFMPELKSKKEKLDYATQTFLKSLEYSIDPKLNVLQLTVSGPSPELTYSLMIEMINQLNLNMETKEHAQAKRDRLFVEKQLLEKKKEILINGKKLSRIFQEKGISATNPNIVVDVVEETVSETSLSSQTKSLRDEFTIKDIPYQVYLDYRSIMKAVILEVHVLLAKNYEMSKIEEAKYTTQLDFIDPPLIPQEKAFPKYDVFIAIVAFVSFLLGLITVFLVDRFQKFRKAFKEYENT